VPVVALVSRDHVYEKMLSNIKEVKARGAYVIAIGEDDMVEMFVDEFMKIPSTSPLFSPILSNIVLQLLAYHTAKILDREIDKPRNLAKSVTVE